MSRMMRVNVNPYLGLTYYTNKIQADKTLFNCPNCNESLTSGAYEQHVSEKHGLDARFCCAWCNGSVFWRGCQNKSKHVKHLVACWRSFLADGSSPLLPPPVAEVSSTGTNDPLLQPPPIEYIWNLPDRAFDMICLLPLKPKLLTFDDAALKPAVSAVQMFLDHTSNDSTNSSNSSRFNSSVRSTTTRAQRHHAKTTTAAAPLKWFHVTVGKQIYKRFLDMIDRHEGNFSTLPFSCWCMVQMDGSCHRHFIVVTNIPNAFMKNVRQLLPSSVASIRVAKIETVLTLVDTLGDLGNQRRKKDKCPFPTSSSSSGGGRELDRIYAYFAIEKLPPDFRLVLLMQWNNGVLHDEMYREIQSRDASKRVIDLSLRALNYVSRDEFTVCKHPTEYALHLIWDEKVFFKPKFSKWTRESNALTPATVKTRPIGIEPTGAGPIAKRMKFKYFPFKMWMEKYINCKRKLRA